MSVFDTIRSWFTSTRSEPIAEEAKPPTVGRIFVRKIRCTVCHEPLEHRDLAIYDNDSVGKTDHLGCRFVVTADDGRFQDIVTGEPVDAPGDREVIGKEVWDAYLAEIDS